MHKQLPLVILLIVFLVIFQLMQTTTAIIHTVLAPAKNDTRWEMAEKKLTHLKGSYSLHMPSSLLSQAHAASVYENARAYIAIRYDSGDVLEQKNANESLPIASLTKIMSAVVALDLLTPTDQITISPTAPMVIPTKIGVDTGERMSLNDLLQAMLMYSANDAAQAINDGIDARYGRGTFIKAMNEKARILGLTHSHFVNSQGFDDPAHYSSASDLAKLSHFALSNYPLISQIVNQQYTVEPATTAHKEYDLPNWNGLLGVYPGVSGVKIGNTGDAGYTTVVTAERGGKKILVVVLGTPGVLQRDMWTAALLDDTFSQVYNLSPIAVTPYQLQAKYASWYSH